jgi:hypothetical protein
MDVASQDVITKGQCFGEGECGCLFQGS